MSDFDDAWSRVVGRSIEPAPEPKARERHDLIQPSPEEAANGWTPETLTKYVREREQAAAPRIDPHHPSRRQRPTRQRGPRWNFPARRSWQIKTPSWQR